MTKSSSQEMVIVARFHLTFEKQIETDEMPYFLTFQVVGWADVFSRKVYRDFILENLAYCKKEKGLFLFGYVIMTNHLHLVVQQIDAK